MTKYEALLVIQGKTDMLEKNDRYAVIGDTF